MGIAAVSAARALTGRPLVAIGGITADRCEDVARAGADSVAVIGALLAPGGSVEQRTRALLDRVQHSSQT